MHVVAGFEELNRALEVGIVGDHTINRHDFVLGKEDRDLCS
jgi:hypothetical protein